MLIQPELPDHPKFIALKAAIGPCAMEVLIRLFGYAQTSKNACIGRVDAAYVKAITRYGGSKDKLWHSLTIPGVVGKAGWLDVSADGTVTVHDFDKHNKNLRAVRENGKLGKPTAPPTAPPTTNLQPPLQCGNEVNGMNRIEVNECVGRFNSMFERGKDDAWSYYEESTLTELLKARPNFRTELEQVEIYRASVQPDRRGFLYLKTLTSLLGHWTEVLDGAKSDVSKKNGAPSAAKKDGDLDLWWTGGIAMVENMWRGLLVSGEKETAARLGEILKQRKGNG